jgi:hypothetical protein
LVCLIPTQEVRYVANDTGLLRPEMARTILDRRTLGIGTPLALLLYHALSVFWIAWDPYWLRKRRSRSRARVAGRATWLVNCLDSVTIRWRLTCSGIWRSYTVFVYRRQCGRTIAQDFRFRRKNRPFLVNWHVCWRSL